MPLFSTNREKRLWLWTLAVVAAIYSTLGFTPIISGFLGERGLLEAAFVAAALLIAIAIMVQGWRSGTNGLQVTVFIGVIAAYFLAFVRMEIPEERTHLIEYGVVALLIHAALMERESHVGHVPVPPLLAIVLTGLLGLIDECIQAVLPNRVFDFRDIFFNFLAGTMAVVGSGMVRWARNRNRAP